MSRTRCILLAAASALLLPQAVHGEDIGGRATEFYAEHCKSCHGADPAAFAGQALRTEGATVTTRHAGPLAEFLARHSAADERDRGEITAMFARLLRPIRQ